MTLSAENLSFGYGAHEVGRNVSFILQPGESLCLLGPNGGGKTTLLKTLLGLIPAQGGHVLIDGEPASRLSRREMARRIAHVPQAHNAFFPFEVRDIVLMGRTAHIGLFATPSEADRYAAEGALQALGIGHLASRVYTEISGGERQLALVARALAQEPQVLVMDEPTANLDFGNQARVLQRMRTLSASGITIIFTSHDPAHAFICGDRAGLLHEGRLIALGAPDDVVTPELLRRIYGVDVAVSFVSDLARKVCAPRLEGDAAPPD